MNRFKKISVVVMTICLCIFSLGAIFLEKATYSDSERRVLASFPEVSLENILDGGFSSQFDEYTTDTFPYRDIFRSIKANVVMNIFQQKDNNQLFQFDILVVQESVVLQESVKKNHSFLRDAK